MQRGGCEKQIVVHPAFKEAKNPPAGERKKRGRTERRKREKEKTQKVADRCTMSMKNRFEANRVVTLTTVSVVVSIEVRLRRRSCRSTPPNIAGLLGRVWGHRAVIR
jgi:hypothetical protein